MPDVTLKENNRAKNSASPSTLGNQRDHQCEATFRCIDGQIAFPREVRTLALKLHLTDVLNKNHNDLSPRS
jgi:hypothetical protein